MGERKGVNKYYPPDYDPKKGGLNKFLGTHALRERARKLHLGILIIRFEMPYNIWCEGCENHIGTGVRYNAEKKKIGMYYSTPIYQFRMKCHLCDNHFEIKTDPGNLDYDIVSGARRQERRWDPGENEQIAPEDKNITRKLAADGMFKLEHGVADKKIADQAKDDLEQLQNLQSSRWKDDYSANSAVRQIMRKKRHEALSQKEKNDKLNINVDLLPTSSDDEMAVKMIQFTKNSLDDKLRKGIFKSESIFSKKDYSHQKSAIARQSLKNIALTSRKIKQKNDFKNKIGVKFKLKNAFPLHNVSSVEESSEVNALNKLITYDLSSSNSD